MARAFSITYQTLDKSLNIKVDLESAVPLAAEYKQIREIRAYKGQKHMPGFYYMRQPRKLVAYESRLEMDILLQLDFNPATISVVSQPFILHYSDGDGEFAHIPDFLVLTDMGEIVIIDVKPKKYVNTSENKRAFRATAEACESVGWTYSVQSEPHRLYIENLRWLAGFRRFRPIVKVYTEPLIEACQEKALPIVELVSEVGYPALVRPVLFYLLFHGALEINMYAQFTNESLIDLPKGAFNHVI